MVITVNLEQIWQFILNHYVAIYLVGLLPAYFVVRMIGKIENNETEERFTKFLCWLFYPIVFPAIIICLLFIRVYTIITNGFVK